MGLYGVLKKTSGHLMGDQCFFDMSDESKFCGMRRMSMSGWDHSGKPKFGLHHGSDPTVSQSFAQIAMILL